MADAKSILISTLRECFLHDGGAAAFFWRERPQSHFATAWEHKSWNKRFAGKPAGWVNGQGYRYVTLTLWQPPATRSRWRLPIARIIWALETGEWPTDEIDHRDRNRANNRFSNLRPATNAEQPQNASLRKDNKSGFTGVRFKSQRRQRPWHAYIRVGRLVHLGFFATKEEAHAARLKAKRELHPFAPKTGVK